MVIEINPVNIAVAGRPTHRFSKFGFFKPKELIEVVQWNYALKHKIAVQMVTGAMKNNGAVEGTISSKDEEYTVPQGFHDGSGKVKIHADEKAKLVANNIREGVTILGVAGSMTGTEGANPQAKIVTPSTSQQEILPDSESGYNYLSQVTVLAIPYSEAENPQGGTTVTIG